MRTAVERIVSCATLVGAFLAVQGAAIGQTEVLSWDGPVAFSQQGYAVAGAGDVDGDGFADVVAGARYETYAGKQEGAVRVLSGFDGNVIHQWFGNNYDWLGSSVAGAGDVNGDGLADIIAGAPGTWGNPWAPVGEAHLLDGATGATLFTVTGTVDYGYEAFEVAGVGDVDGDGADDVAVATLYDDTIALNAGRVSVLSGTGALIYTVFGDQEKSMFGDEVAGAGDVNADGFADMIVSASGSSSFSAPASAYVRVFAGPTGSVLYTFPAAVGTLGDGSAVSSAGDIDGDGHSDLIVGDQNDDTMGQNVGVVRLYSGIDGTLIREIYGDPCPSSSCGFAETVGHLGDVDEDGVDDFAIGASGFHNWPDWSGLARVYSGSTGSELLTILGPVGPGAVVGTGFGSALDAAGDTNGDNSPDLLVGAWQYSSGGIILGKTFVYSIMGPVEAFGGGCSGLRQGWLNGPEVGSSAFQLRLEGGPGFAPALLITGASNTSWLGVPLPFDMALLGAPGCDLLVSVGPTVPALLNAAGTLTLNAPIPNEPSLTGARLFTQWAVLDAGANPLGIVLSDGLDITIHG